MIIRDYWSYLITNNHRIIDILFDDYFIDYLLWIIPIIKRLKTKCEYLVHFWQHMTSVIIGLIWWLFDDYLMIIWWLFDDYLMIILHYWDYLLLFRCKNVNDNDSPLFAFARLCCLKIPVARFASARPAKVTSDVLDSSPWLQGVPRAPRCMRWALYERKDVNSPLQFVHLKCKNRSVCLLCVWLIWRRIGNLSKYSESDWASWLPLAAFPVTWTAERFKIAWPQPISQNTKEQ